MEACSSSIIEDMEPVTVKVEPDIKLEPMDPDDLEIYSQSLIKIEDEPKVEDTDSPFASLLITSESPVKENSVNFEFVHEVQYNNNCVEADQNWSSADPLNLDFDTGASNAAPVTSNKCYVLNVDSISFAMVKCTEPYHAEPVDSSVLQVEEQLGNINFQCSRCSRKMYTYERVLSHFKQMHKLVFQCQICSLKIHTPKQLLKHLKDLGVVAVQSFMRKRFEGFINADLEKIQQQKEKLLKIKDGIATTSMKCNIQFSCLFCNKTFLTGFQMWKHLESIHHYCSTCCVSFATSSQFITHKNKHENGSIRFFACKKCEKKLKTKHQLEKHWKLYHVSKKGLPCETKVEYGRFSQHYMEFNISGFYCPYCFIFNQKEHILESHMQLHQVLGCIHCKCKFISNSRDKDSELCTICNMNSTSLLAGEPTDPCDGPLDQLLKANTDVGIPLNSYLGQILQAQLNIRNKTGMNDKQNATKTKLVLDSDDEQSGGKKIRLSTYDSVEQPPPHDDDGISFVGDQLPESSGAHNNFVHTDETRAKLMSEIPKDCPLYQILKASQSSKNETGTK